jgi:signal peptidase II
MTLKKSIFIVIAVLLTDQIFKFYIKLNYPLTLYGSDAIVDWGWFRLLFVENKGMAWGTKINDFLPFVNERYGKLFLTVFRIIAVTAIGYWLLDAIKKLRPSLLIVSLSLIFAGAVGNIIDSIFYGYMFTDSYGQVATFEWGAGYESFLYGHVVDMLQFPLVTWTWPSWIPGIGGDSFTFFDPIFNIADVAISTGVGILLVFNKKIFPKN